jgi:hypothetical protein
MREIRITHTYRTTFEQLQKSGHLIDLDSKEWIMVMIIIIREWSLKKEKNEIMAKPGVAQERNLCCTAVVRA